MTYLLDTNVVSEWVKLPPDPGVISWLDSLEEDAIFLSVASLAEIRRGIESMPSGQRRDRLEEWLDITLVERFSGRILPIDRSVAEMWGVLAARVRMAGYTVGPMDIFFAATAAVHGLVLATRNERDFAHLGISVVNPWHEDP